MSYSFSFVVTNLNQLSVVLIMQLFNNDEI